MEKFYKVSETQMDLICSIINTVIEKSSDDEINIDTLSMGYNSDKHTWGMQVGDDIEDAELNETDVADSLELVLKNCF